MANQRRSAPSRPKAKKAIRSAKVTKKPAAKAHVVKPATVAKKGAAPGSKTPARLVAARVVPAKGVAKAGAKPKLKTLQRPPAPVHPIGVLPPEAVSRATHKPARPIPMSARTPAKALPPIESEAGSQPVTESDFNDFEQRLRGERVRVLKEMGHYESTVLKVNPRDSAGDLSGYSFHMADVGTDAMEREKAFQLASAEGRLLLEINEALRRLARGEYGICESCGNPILRARLEAMPTARLCLSCKEKEERGARGGA